MIVMVNFVTGKKQSPQSHCGVHLAAAQTDAQLDCLSLTLDAVNVFVYVVTCTGALEVSLLLFLLSLFIVLSLFLCLFTIPFFCNI
jgi:hypothetical protein